MNVLFFSRMIGLLKFPKEILNKLSPNLTYICVRTIQRIYRGFLGRKKARLVKENQLKLVRAVNILHWKNKHRLLRIKVLKSWRKKRNEIFSI